MEFQDYYAILGLPETASAQDIKTAYRKLARRYHPDVSKEADAEIRFKQVGEAYEVLKDPEKRAEYDQLRRYGANREGQFEPPPDWESNAHFRGGGFTDFDSHQFSDFFESIFGRRGEAEYGFQQRRQADGMRLRGEDLHQRIALFLEEAYRGGERQIQLQVPEVKPQGLISHRLKTLKVKIPQGVADGQQIRLKGQGAPGIGGGPPGDLYLEIELAPHPLYTVKKKDLYITVPIAPWEAALGAKVQVPTLAGAVTLTVPANAQAGKKLRIRGKGLPGDPAGDLYAVLQVVMPEQLSDQAKALYEQLAAESTFNPRQHWGASHARA